MKPNSGALRYFGRIKNGTTPASGEAEYWDGDVRWATPEDLGRLTTDRITATKRMVTEKAVEENNLSILPVGSILISTRAPIGHMAINAEPMAFNQGCRGIIPSDRVYGPFLYYLLKSRAPELSAMANGTTFVELSRDELASVPVELPPLETQQRIARFLDEKTARIDGLIEKKRALLDRLAEKRQALITRAVTKGLNLDAPMKPSGIDWLGDIPAHWEVKQLRRVRQYITSGSRDWAAYYADHGEPFLRMTNVTGRGVELDLDDLRFVALDGVTEGTRTSVREGDILITITAELGAVAIVRKNIEGAYINQHLALFRPDPTLCAPDFLVNFLSTDITRAQFTVSGQGGTKQGLGFEQVNNVIIGFPPRDEQELIGSFCNHIWQQFELVDRHLSASIERLTEYRAALITAAVTGNLREKNG